jgi:hypothetical protein
MKQFNALSPARCRGASLGSHVLRSLGQEVACPVIVRPYLRDTKSFRLKVLHSPLPSLVCSLVDVLCICVILRILFFLTLEGFSVSQSYLYTLFKILISGILTVDFFIP